MVIYTINDTELVRKMQEISVDLKPSQLKRIQMAINNNSDSIILSLKFSQLMHGPHVILTNKRQYKSYQAALAAGRDWKINMKRHQYVHLAKPEPQAGNPMAILNFTAPEFIRFGKNILGLFKKGGMPITDEEAIMQMKAFNKVIDHAKGKGGNFENDLDETINQMFNNLPEEDKQGSGAELEGGFGAWPLVFLINRIIEAKRKKGSGMILDIEADIEEIISDNKKKTAAGVRIY